MAVSRRSFLAVQGAVIGASLAPTSLLAAVAAKSQPMPRLDDWAEVRKQFRLSPDYRHFAGFYLVSHPAPVRAAIEALRQALDENPYMAVEHGMFEPDNLQLRVCAEVAEYLGGKGVEIALTPNTTTGLALVYHGLPLAPGDEILTTVHDHVVHHEAIRLASERNGASVRKVALFDEAASATADGIVGRVRDAIRPETRVLGITWVHSATGIRLPIRKIADAVAERNRKRGEKQRVWLVVDGVHGLGAVDETVASLGCDFFSAGTHKWMFAPRGTGLVWAPAANWAVLRPTLPSFSNQELYDAWIEGRPARGPNTADRVTPGGFLAYEHQWAMGAAFQMHKAMGRARVAERIRLLNDRCKRGLAAIAGVTLHTPLDPSLSAGINCFELQGRKPDDVVTALLSRHILASASPYAVSYVRLSAGLMNTPEEVDEAVAAVRTLA